MNLSTGEVVGLAWMLSGALVLIARLLKIGLFGMFYNELRKMYDRPDMNDTMQDMYYQVARERRESGLASQPPRLHEAIGLPLTAMMIAIYIVIHLLFGPFMFSALESDLSNRS